MWQLDQTGTAPYRVTSWSYNITRVPQPIADDHFDGDAMAFGPGKSTGSRGSSLGPSVGVRPWTVPTTAADGFVPLVYYLSPGGYPRWYQPSKFRGATDAQATLCSRTPGGEFVRIGDREAYVTLGQRAVVNTAEYPANDPDGAGPTEAGYAGQTYQDDPCWPDPLQHPVQWYGIEECDGGGGSGAAAEQQPSFHDYDCNGGRIPTDCNLVSTCSHGTGPSCSNKQIFLYLYSLTDLAAAHAGSRDPETIQPYYERQITVDLDGDGWDEIENCVQPGVWSGVTADHDRGYLLFAHGVEPGGSAPPYSGGSRMGVSVYALAN
ncbi:MAG: hypothetical protein JRI23_23805 [Deltaproteobacteria bacterium]|jgi:hypothetical protein|nr:hypothetical protein [Deltaproteobacteria bacterium]MBW2535017.1 hypothetical protein [Deltaproteobacteria bacterium]